MKNEVVKKEKDKKGLIIGILVIIVAGLVGFIVYDKKFGENKNNEQAENSINNNNNNNDKKLIVTYEEAEEISKEFDTIMYGGFESTTFNTVQAYSDYFLLEEVFATLNLSQETKNIIALKQSEEAPVSEKNKSSKVFIELKNEFVYEDGFTEISAEEVEKIYKSYFGGSIEHKDIDGCPNFYYDLDNNVYYVYRECGGDNPDEIISYKYNYKKENENTISFNIALALKIYEGEVCNPEFYGIVDPHDKKTYYNRKCGKIVTQDGNSFYLDNSNKNKFTNYKVTFKNIEGNYAFDKIEKISA